MLINILISASRALWDDQVINKLNMASKFVLKFSDVVIDDPFI